MQLAAGALAVLAANPNSTWARAALDELIQPRHTEQAMSQENVEIVRRAYDIWAEGEDLATSLTAFDNALVIRPIIGPEWHGPDGLLAMAADWIEDFAEWSMSAEAFIDSGSQVVVKVHQTGIGETSRVPVKSDYWFVNTLREGKITRLEIYADQTDALEAAGLSE